MEAPGTLVTDFGGGCAHGHLASRDEKMPSSTPNPDLNLNPNPVAFSLSLAPRFVGRIMVGRIMGKRQESSAAFRMILPTMILPSLPRKCSALWTRDGPERGIYAASACGTTSHENGTGGG
jgi:hypothetical protein